MDNVLKKINRAHNILSTGLSVLQDLSKGNIPIVFKTVEINLFFIIARRILCKNCLKPFNYIFWQKEKAVEPGIPLISKTDSMQIASIINGITLIRKKIRKKNLGISPCPHCNHMQRFMEKYFDKASINKKLKRGLLTGWWCGWLIGFPIVLLMDFDSILPLIISITLFPFIGFIYATTTTSKQNIILKSMSLTDDELASLFEKCEEEEIDPFMAWYTTAETDVISANQHSQIPYDSYFNYNNLYDDDHFPIAIGIEDLAETPSKLKYQTKTVLDNIEAFYRKEFQKV